jgi:hypothetical protein
MLKLTAFALFATLLLAEIAAANDDSNQSRRLRLA